jgi:hypothetical protein
VKRQTEIERIATMIAIAAPRRRSPWVHYAYVSWELIELLRAALRRDGVDWVKLHKTAEKIANSRGLFAASSKKK